MFSNLCVYRGIWGKEHLPCPENLQPKRLAGEPVFLQCRGSGNLRRAGFSDAEHIILGAAQLHAQGLLAIRRYPKLCSLFHADFHCLRLQLRQVCLTEQTKLQEHLQRHRTRRSPSLYFLPHYFLTAHWAARIHPNANAERRLPLELSFFESFVARHRLLCFCTRLLCTRIPPCTCTWKYKRWGRQ